MNTKYKFLKVSDEELQKRIEAAVTGLTLSKEDKEERCFTIVSKDEWGIYDTSKFDDIFVDLAPWFYDGNDPDHDSPEIIGVHADDINTFETFDEMIEDVEDWLDVYNQNCRDNAGVYSDRTEENFSLAEIEKALIRRYGAENRERGCYMPKGGWLSVDKILSTIAEIC